MSGHVDVRLPYILSCLPLRTFWLYYPPIPFLQQIIAVLQGERCLTLWNVSHVKTDRIMFESSLIEVLTADVWNFVSALCLTALLKCLGVVKPPEEDEALSDISGEWWPELFKSWTIIALFSTLLILDTEVCLAKQPSYATPSVFPRSCAADTHEGDLFLGHIRKVLISKHTTLFWSLDCSQRHCFTIFRVFLYSIGLKV